MTELEQIRQYFRNAADQYAVIAEDPATAECNRENIRGQAIGFSLAANHITIVLKAKSDERYSAHLAKLGGRAA